MPAPSDAWDHHATKFGNAGDLLKLIPRKGGITRARLLVRFMGMRGYEPDDATFRRLVLWLLHTGQAHATEEYNPNTGKVRQVLHRKVN